MFSVVEIGEKVDEQLAKKLASFEHQFSYPLGSGRTFSISHGNDYTRFFRAMGTSRTIAVLFRDEIAGVVSSSIKKIQLPDTSLTDAAYICDLKIAEEYRKSRVLLSLIQPLKEWIVSRCDRAFSIVMDGTAVAPDMYTGRLGIPRFEKLSSITLFQIDSRKNEQDIALPKGKSAEEFDHTFRRLATGHLAVLSGEEGMRSALPPLPIVVHTNDGEACGTVEDTRLAKTLNVYGEGELVVGHLSSFAFSSVKAAGELIQHSLSYAATNAIPGLFIPVSTESSREVEKLLIASGYDYTIARASVFGVNLPQTEHWIVNSSEI